MDKILTKTSFKWKIGEFTRQHIRKRLADFRRTEADDDPIYPDFRSSEFACCFAGIEIKWKCYFQPLENGNCIFSIRSYDRRFGEFFNFEIKPEVSIQQSDGVVKKIKSKDAVEFPDIGQYEMLRWDEFLSINAIFNPQNKYLDSNSTLTFIIDLTVTHKNHDGSLLSQCGFVLANQISIDNVIELLHYADRCNLKHVKEKCLEFIYDNYEEVKKNKAKWKNISTELMFKIMDALKYEEFC